MTYGRTYDEQRFSPLDRINAANASRLRLAWHHDLPVDRRAQESTPLVIDGVMYVTGAWSTVFALDPTSGKLLWSYDPQVPRATDINACCDAVNRGVAAWNGKLYLGTLDGRLVWSHSMLRPANPPGSCARLPKARATRSPAPRAS
jgi:quinohemoprotein ethanol dehydrogenase